MKKGRVTPNLDSRQTSQNIDFFNTIRTKRTFAAGAPMAAFYARPSIAYETGNSGNASFVP